MPSIVVARLSWTAKAMRKFGKRLSRIFRQVAAKPTHKGTNFRIGIKPFV
jgi:hypothetical protein